MTTTETTILQKIYKVYSPTEQVQLHF